MTTSDYPQKDDLKLEVEQPAGTGLRNLIVNPNGDLGGWGWQGNHVATDPETTLQQNGMVGNWTLLATLGGGAAGRTMSVYSAPFPVTAGKYVGAYAYLLELTNIPSANLGLTFYDATGAVVAGGGTVNNNTINTGWRITKQVPAGAVTAQAFLNATSTASGAAWLGFKNVTAAQADTSAALSALGYIDPDLGYTDVIGSAINATITREDLNVAELSATIKDVTLDPSTVDLLRPGRRCKLSARTSFGTYELLFTGRIDNAPVVYDAAEAKPAKRATITLHAVDDVALLANTGAPNGYATLDQLTSVLEAVLLVPWNVNGNNGHVTNKKPVTTNPDATALDQVVIARDSARAFAWMDRLGILHVADTAHLNSSSLTLAEADYDSAGPEAGWDLDEVINDITLTHVVRNAITGETTEVTWGPFQDLASVRQWGVRHRDITVQGLTNDAATMRAYAQAVFATNAQPASRVRSVTVPIRSNADIKDPVLNTNRKALRDLYDKVRVTNTNLGLDQTARVTKIVHDIAPGSWDMTFGFSRDGGSPVGVTPSSTPAVPSGPGTVGITAPEKPHCEFPKTAAQTLTTSVTTTVSGYAAATVNVGGITQAAGVFTVPRAGRYLISGSVTFAGNATGRRAININKNGANFYPNSMFPTGTSPGLLSTSGPLACVAGDTLSLTAQQASGANLDITAAQFTITYLD